MSENNENKLVGEVQLQIHTKINKLLTKEDIFEYLKKEEDISINNWDQIPSPYDFKNMEKAVNIYMNAIQSNMKIKVVHDSDADGLGTYLLSWYFYSTFYYSNLELLIVDRKKGYGLIPEHIEDNCLIITADNGITAIEACKKAKSLNNCKIIITDHHQVDSHFGLPDADAIINPWIPNCEFKYKEINGTFVYWFFLKAIQEKFNINLDMKTFLPELTLTTISDVMPLIHINRFIVKEGLKQFKHSDRRWVKTFIETHKIQEPLAEDLAFKIIPSLNVTSRLTKADESAIFLIQPEYMSSHQWFGYLNNLNNQRKKLQENLLKLIENRYSSWLEYPFIIIPGTEEEGFHKGLLGPIAGRLVEKYKKPALVLVKTKGSDYFSGSGRSVGDVDILSIVKNNNFVLQDKTGGHKVACGVAVQHQNFNYFWHYCINEVIKIPRDYFKEYEYVLGKINLREIDLELYENIKSFEPFGEGYKRPTFLVKGQVKNPKKLGKDATHMSFYLEDGLGARVKCLYFFTPEEIKTGSYSFLCTIQKDEGFNNSEPNVCLYIKKIVPIMEWEKESE